MIELDNSFEEITKIAVVGVGGAGCNAIQNLISFGIDGVDLIAVNTDIKQLRQFRADQKAITLPIGRSITKGQGAGSNPEIGRLAAEEDYQNIVEFLKNKDMVFVTAGMGGGTGTGAAPIVAKAAKENDALVVGIVVTPLKSEGMERWENAFKGIENLRKNLDGLIIISNEKLSHVSKEKSLSVKKAFQYADKVIYDATKGIIDLINSVGIINVDFADVKTVIQGKGDALIGKGVGEGEQGAIDAVEQALNSPLLEGIDLRNAKSALVNITFGEDFENYKVDLVLNRIREATNSNLNIIHGLVEDPSMGDSVSITVVVTGFTNSFLQEYYEKKKDNEKKQQKTSVGLGLGDFIPNDVGIPAKNNIKTPVNIKVGKKELSPRENDLDIPTVIREESLKTNNQDYDAMIEIREPYYFTHEDINTIRNEDTKNGMMPPPNSEAGNIAYLTRLMD
jgi:cell division protein FtsZ